MDLEYKTREYSVRKRDEIKLQTIKPYPPKESLIWRSGGACVVKGSWELSQR
jgi:hypothetical protein